MAEYESDPGSTKYTPYIALMFELLVWKTGLYESWFKPYSLIQYVRGRYTTLPGILVWFLIHQPPCLVNKVIRICTCIKPTRCTYPNMSLRTTESSNWRPLIPTMTLFNHHPAVVNIQIVIKEKIVTNDLCCAYIQNGHPVVSLRAEIDMNWRWLVCLKQV